MGGSLYLGRGPDTKLTLQVELKSTIELLHEEQERVIKIETIKKSLEVEVKVSLNWFENG